MNEDERGLKQTFDKLREDDARRAPSFEDVRRRRAKKRSPWAVVVPLASTAAAAAVFVMWCNVRREAAPVASAAAPAASVAAVAMATPSSDTKTRVDEAPLDFLLDVPGFRGTPNFDTSFLRGSLR